MGLQVHGNLGRKCMFPFHSLSPSSPLFFSLLFLSLLYLDLNSDLQCCSLAMTWHEERWNG